MSNLFANIEMPPLEGVELGGQKNFTDFSKDMSSESSFSDTSADTI